MRLKPLALYIHIPFCQHKCIYCDFYSLPLHSLPNGASEIRRQYLESLKKEFLSYKDRVIEGHEIISIYLGGGTPSILDVSEIKFIKDFIYENGYVKPGAEFSIETNPGTASEEKLRCYLNIGINRISIGVQSLDDRDLKFLSRIHTAGEAEDIISKAREIGFKNISLDLIFNLPNQTSEKWLYNLKRAVALPVDHVSAYSLIVEEETELFRMVQNKQVVISDSETDSDLYLETIEFLEKNGFYQYEVSNFAKPGFESIHNNAYWNYSDYLALGCSSHSFVNGERWWNVRDLHAYVKSVDETGTAQSGSELLSHDQQFEEFIMLRLRCGRLDFAEVEKRFGVDLNNFLKKTLDQYSAIGLLKFTDGLVTLTPKGFSLADEIISKFLSEISPR